MAQFRNCVDRDEIREASAIERKVNEYTIDACQPSLPLSACTFSSLPFRTVTLGLSFTPNNNVLPRFAAAAAAAAAAPHLADGDGRVHTALPGMLTVQVREIHVSVSFVSRLPAPRSPVPVSLNHNADTPYRAKYPPHAKTFMLARSLKGALPLALAISFNAGLT